MISLDKIQRPNLYYVSIMVTEGANMASESANSGTPVIYVNPLILGYLGTKKKLWLGA